LSVNGSRRAAFLNLCHHAIQQTTEIGVRHDELRHDSQLFACESSPIQAPKFFPLVFEPLTLDKSSFLGGTTGEASPRNDRRQKKTLPLGKGLVFRLVLVEPVVFKPIRYDVCYLRIVLFEHHYVAVTDNANFRQVNEFGISAVLIHFINERLRVCEPRWPSPVEVVTEDNQDWYLR
jgi:hypothetical protein